MTRTFILIAVALASYALVSAAVSAVVMLLTRRRSEMAGRGTLLALCAAPTILATAVAVGLVVPVFLWLEPADVEEEVGLALLVAASAGLGLFVAAAIRGAMAFGATMKLERIWRSHRQLLPPADGPVPAYVLRSPAPVAAVVGWHRPRIYVGKRILELCTAEELETIVAHERAHASAHDNLTGWMLQCLPDWLAMTASGKSLHRQWRRLAEVTADHRATGDDPRRRLALASAIIKIARLLPPGERVSLAIPATIDGGDVPRRVAALIGPTGFSPSDHEPRSWVYLSSLALAVPLVTLIPPCRNAVYEAIELFVGM